jgi:hypothetical protein
MSTNFLTPGCKILRALMAGRGWATLSAICLRTRGKKAFQDAQKELEGLIITREERPWRRRRYRTRTVVYLTAKGWAACAAINPKWTPTRLAPEVLQEWFKELQRERHPWAMNLQNLSVAELVKLREDSRKLAELRSANRIRPHSPKKMGSPKAIPGVMPEALKPHAFQPKVATAGYRGVDYARRPDPIYNVPVTPAAPARPLPARSFAQELAEIQGSQLAGFGESSRGFDNRAKPADVEETNRLLALFHNTDFAGRLLPNNMVEYGGEGRIISLRQWEKERLGQSQ